MNLPWKFENRLNDYFEVESEDTIALLEEYLCFGWYPSVVLEDKIAVTLKNYLVYSEKTFVTKRITPFYTNLRKEITKSPVYYFFDLGLRNYILNMFDTQSINYEKPVYSI